MPRFLSKLGFVLVFVFVALLAQVQDTSAQSKFYSFVNYDVEFQVNSDSTIDVTESITYQFTGEFSVVERGITLQDFEDTKRCKENPDLQCGGFDAVTITGAAFDGEELEVKDLDTFIYEDEYTRELKVEYDFGQTQFRGDEIVWELEYKIYGGLGFFEDYDLFYWNVFPESRSEDIESGFVDIEFDSGLTIEKADFEVLGSFGNYEYEIQFDGLELSVDDLAAYDDFTVLLKFDKGIVEEPIKVNLDLSPSPVNIEYLSVSEGFRDGQTIFGLPAGSHDLAFSKTGFKSQEVEVSGVAGEEIDLSVELEKEPWLQIVSLGSIILNLIFCGLVPIVFGLIVYRWYVKGRDIGGKKTIVPWFKPPEDIRPYLLGSIKDEKVDTIDLTSTLIDVAYRGYIKIKEISKSKYEFIKLKPFTDLSKIEKEILGGVFGSKDKVTTSGLKNKFYLKIPSIKKNIYREMVEKGYFEVRPDNQRNSYLGCGIAMLVFGVVLFVAFAAAAAVLITGFDVWPPVTLGVLFVIAGLTNMAVAPFMPAKTAKGTLIYEKAKGFKMFLHTAERFRMAKNAPEYVKNLEPKTFEKFLSYAVVFGVEKEWSKTFKDIYKGQPDWYEGRSGTDFTTIYLVSSLARMNTITSKAMTTSPSSSGASGGGWSGGGGFSGGFSGGGGGGGSIGAR